MKWFDSLARAFKGDKSQDSDTRQQDGTVVDATLARDATQGDTLDAGATSLLPLIQQGEVIGGYHIDRLLAEGGMGQVYLAHRADDSSSYAFKTVTLAPGQDSHQIVERFKREVAMGQIINHQNVCRLLDAGASDERHYLVMEYLVGQTLAEDIAARAPLPATTVQEVLRQILCGLEAIHGAGVVHRDLKPANVMLVEDGTVKIMDLGISQSVIGPCLTRTGSALGTPQFIAPEQLADAKRVDNRADLFCAGLIGYQMLSGHLPYDAPRLTLRMQRLVKGDQTPLETWCPHLPASLGQWIARMTRHDRDFRFPSAAQARAALEALSW